MSPQAHSHAHQPFLPPLPPPPPACLLHHHRHAHAHAHAHPPFPAFARPAYSTTQPTPVPSLPSHAPHTPHAPPHMLSPPMPTPSPSSSARPSRPAPPPPAHSHRLARPKTLKKPSASTGNKHRTVQMSLEVKVEKAKGFHAFFVPLCKGEVPPAPPCSPVHAHGQLKERREEGDEVHEADPGSDYFGAWSRQSEKERDEWVEHTSDGMEVDRF